ncbi:unnamed protein product, partial [Iphiclides podalirius]
MKINFVQKVTFNKSTILALKTSVDCNEPTTGNEQKDFPNVTCKTLEAVVFCSKEEEFQDPIAGFNKIILEATQQCLATEMSDDQKLPEEAGPSGVRPRLPAPMDWSLVRITDIRSGFDYDKDKDVEEEVDTTTRREITPHTSPGRSPAGCDPVRAQESTQPIKLDEIDKSIVKSHRFERELKSLQARQAEKIHIIESDSSDSDVGVTERYLIGRFEPLHDDDIDDLTNYGVTDRSYPLGVVPSPSAFYLDIAKETRYVACNRDERRPKITGRGGSLWVRPRLPAPMDWSLVRITDIRSGFDYDKDKDVEEEVDTTTRREITPHTSPGRSPAGCDPVRAQESTQPIKLDEIDKSIVKSHRFERELKSLQARQAEKIHIIESDSSDSDVTSVDCNEPTTGNEQKDFPNVTCKTLEAVVFCSKEEEFQDPIAGFNKIILEATQQCLATEMSDDQKLPEEAGPSGVRPRLPAPMDWSLVRITDIRSGFDYDKDKDVEEEVDTTTRREITPHTSPGRSPAGCDPVRAQESTQPIKLDEIDKSIVKSHRFERELKSLQARQAEKIISLRVTVQTRTWCLTTL